MSCCLPPEPRREMNAAAEDGYRFQEVMGGDTAFGGSEVVAIMMRGSTSAGRFAYRLLATNRTSTLEPVPEQLTLVLS